MAVTSLSKTVPANAGPAVRSPKASEPSLIEMVRYASQTLDSILERRLKHVGLDTTARQARILTTVADNPGITQSNLVTTLNIDRSTVSEIVIRLSANKLLKRAKRKEDARIYTLSLTAAGQDLAVRIGAILSLLETDIESIQRSHARVFLQRIAEMRA